METLTKPQIGVHLIIPLPGWLNGSLTRGKNDQYEEYLGWRLRGRVVARDCHDNFCALVKGHKGVFRKSRILLQENKGSGITKKKEDRKMAAFYIMIVAAYEFAAVDVLYELAPVAVMRAVVPALQDAFWYTHFVFMIVGSAIILLQKKQKNSAGFKTIASAAMGVLTHVG